MEKSTRSPTVYIDPVCLMKVDSGKRDLMYTHRMRTYYFCAEFCRKTFEKNPLFLGKFLKMKTVILNTKLYFTNIANI